MRLKFPSRQKKKGADKDIITAKVIKEAVKEFMVMEMKVKDEHFHKLNIVRTFTPQKSDWQTVYVELESEDQVDWIMSHTRWIPEQEKGQIQTKVVKYVPRQLFNRWNAIQAEAFKIRKESNWRTQTKVGHGKEDFLLQTRSKGERLWNTNLLPADLPKVELEFLSREERSPASAPGREKYKRTQRIDKRKERPSNSSSSSESPPQKQSNKTADSFLRQTSAGWWRQAILQEVQV